MLIKKSFTNLELFERSVETLLRHAFSTNHSLYLLGSGVSARLSKMEKQAAETIVSIYNDIGHFHVNDMPSDSLANRFLLRHMSNHKNELFRELTKKTPNSLIKSCVNELFSQQTFPKDIAEYQVFLLAKKGATIIDMNYEGFAKYFLNNYHYIINIHGLANPMLAKYTQEIRDKIIAWDIDLSTYSNIKVYPGERQTFETIKPHIQFLSDQVCPKLLWIVIIGYSFANTDTGLNDGMLYELLNEYIAHYKKIQLIIINPKPEPIVALFEKYMDRVTIIPVYWHAFTKSITVNQNISSYNSLRKIIFDYHVFLDE